MIDASDVIRKIKALLDLANGVGVHKGERENALRMALDLQRKYRISQASLEVKLNGPNSPEVGEQEPFSKGQFPCKAVRHPAHDGACSLLRAHFNVKVVTMDHKAPYHVVILGRRSNVTMAKFIYDFIIRSFDRAWLDHCLERNVAPSLKIGKAAFYRGLYLGQKEILGQVAAPWKDKARVVENVTNASRALMVQNQLTVIDKSEEQLLEEYLKRVFPGAKGGKAKTSKGMDRDILKAGINAGKNISIRKPLSDSKKLKPLRLH